MYLEKILCLSIMVLILLSSTNSVVVNGLKIEGEKDIESYEQLSSKKWTFMAYLDHDYYDLENVLLEYINEMEEIGTNDDVNIIVQVDDYNLWNGQTRMYEIKKDSANSNEIISVIVNDDITEKNMGDHQTLVDFVKWASNNYPADRYCLTLFNHGNGWEGICSDMTNQDKIELSELKEALSQIKNHLGKKLDIIIYFACLMGMIEVLYETKDYVDITIAPEGNIGKRFLSFKEILKVFRDNAELSTGVVSKKIIDNGYFQIEDKKYHYFFGMKMDKINSLSKEINDLSQALIQYMPDKSYILDVYDYSCVKGSSNDQPPYPHDIHLIAEYVSINQINNDLTNAAEKTLEAFDDVVICPTEGEEDVIPSTLKGISIYFPPKKSGLFNEYYDSSYEKLEFAKDTYWDDFIREFFNKTDYSSVTYKNREHVLIDLFTSFINAPIMRLLCYRFAALG